MKQFFGIQFLMILFFIVGYSHAEEISKKFGDWETASIFYKKGQPVAIASTKNESNSVLGVFCFADGTCVPFFNGQMVCEDGSEYPALISTDSGFDSISMECIDVSNQTYLFMLPQDHLNYIISDNTYGIAFGLENGRFQAAYFSLNGSAKAIIEAKQMLDSASTPNIEKEKHQTKYKDTVL